MRHRFLKKIGNSEAYCPIASIIDIHILHDREKLFNIA